MKINKYYLYKQILFSTLIFSIFVKTASAQWKLPKNDFNLPSDFDAIILAVTNWLLGFVGTVAVLAIVYGGFRYVYSAGNEDQATDAKRTIKWAIMGLIIAGIAYAVVYVIINTIK